MNRIEEEIIHGKKILPKAEKIWGWGTPAGKRRVSRRIKIFIQLCKLTENTKVLEIGCGTGVFTKKLAETGANVTAVDICTDLIIKASQTVKYPNVKFCVMNIESMKFGNESFDVVIGVSVLHHN